MQYASRHTSIVHPGQASPAVAGQRDEVRVFALGSLYDRVHNASVLDERPRFDPFLAELSLETRQICFRLPGSLLEFLLMQRHMSPLRPHNEGNRLDHS